MRCQILVRDFFDVFTAYVAELIQFCRIYSRATTQILFCISFCYNSLMNIGIINDKVEKKEGKVRKLNKNKKYGRNKR